MQVYGQTDKPELLPSEMQIGSRRESNRTKIRKRGTYADYQEGIRDRRRG